MIRFMKRWNGGSMPLRMRKGFSTSGSENAKTAASTTKDAASPTKPSMKSSSNAPVYFALLVGVPSSLMLYIRSNPTWNPSFLQNNEVWQKMRETVLGSSAIRIPSSSLESVVVNKEETEKYEVPAPKVMEGSSELQQNEISVHDSEELEKSTKEVESTKATEETPEVTTGKQATIDEKIEEATVDEISDVSTTIEAVEAHLEKEITEPVKPTTKKSEPVDFDREEEYIQNKIEKSMQGERQVVEKMQSEARDIEQKTESAASPVMAQISDELQLEAESIQRDLEKNVLLDLEKLDAHSLRIRVAQLATEMKNRTKWEAVRLLESLRKVEDELSSKHMKNLRHQSELHQEIMARELRIKEETVSRQSREALENLRREYARKLEEAVTSQKDKMRDDFEAEFQAEKKSHHKHMDQLFTARILELKEEQEAERLERIKDLERLKVQIQALHTVLDNTSSYEAFSHQVHKVSVAAMALSSQIETSTPITRELEDLRAAGKGDYLIESVLKTIPNEVIREGAPTLAQLQNRFKYVKTIGKRASLIPEGSGILGHLFGTALSWVVISPAGPVEGDDSESILSRAAYKLEAGNLKQAVEEMERLKDYPAEVCQDWVNAAKSRLALEQATAVIKAHVSLLAASCA